MAGSLVFFALFGLTVADFNILLLHTNDMHSHFEQTDVYSGTCENLTSTACYGGFARLHSQAVLQKQLAAARGRPTIFLNAGDSFQGTPYYTFFKWPIVSQFVSMLGIDVMSLGNHEFDDGIPGLAPYIANVTVPNVCCNINTTLEPTMNQPNLTPSKVLTVNGTKIGVIGYLTPDTTMLSNTGKLQIYDEIPSIRAEAQRLLALNVTILIALGHSGYVKDQQIAKEVEEIDLVVGGHSHTFLYTGTPPSVEVAKGPYPTVVTQASGKKVPVVQAYYATKYLGYLELDFDDQGNLTNWDGLPILLRGNMTQDPVVLDALIPYHDKLAGKIDQILGYTDVLLDNRDTKCKLGECNIGNLIADAYVDYATRHNKSYQGWTIAPIGIVQAGNIRSSIDTQTNVNHNGSITLEDVITVSPWGDKVVVVNMTGTTLLQALEYSVTRYQQTLTGHVSEFLQVSGLHVVYDMSLPTGHRVVSVSARCSDCDVPTYQPLLATQIYGVVMPEYLLGGGDGFTMFEPLTNPVVLGDDDYVIIADYITAHSPIYPTIEGRIKIKSNSSTSAAASLSASLIVLFSSLFLYFGKFYFN